MWKWQLADDLIAERQSVSHPDPVQLQVASVSAAADLPSLLLLICLVWQQVAGTPAASHKPNVYYLLPVKIFE